MNGLVEYSIIPGDNVDHDDDRIHSEDGYGFFAINLPHQGQVTVNRTLDFEKTQRYYVTVVATVSDDWYFSSFSLLLDWMENLIWIMVSNARGFFSI